MGVGLLLAASAAATRSAMQPNRVPAHAECMAGLREGYSLTHDCVWEQRAMEYRNH